MKVLFILNDASYSTENAYLTLRLAMIMQREHSEVEVRVFLLGDSVTCAIPYQDTPQGYYNLERMIKSIISKGGTVDICSSCMKSRGLTELDLIQGVVKTKFSSLSDLIVEYDKVITL